MNNYYQTQQITNIIPPLPKRAAYYARVSTDNQEQEETIQNQIPEILKAIKQDGNILQADCRFEDNGYTGSVLEREGLDAMRNAARAGKFDILYVYDRGRLSRIFFHQELVIDELSSKEIEFKTLHDFAARNPEEALMQKVQGIFFEFERLKIQERFRLGKMRKVNQGKILGYVPAYGYIYHVRTKEEDGYIEINKTEAKVVFMIFKWVGEEQISHHEVIRRLDQLHILPRKRKRETWSKGPILRMLRNTSYIGKHYYNTSQACVSKKRRNGKKYSRLKNNSRRTRPREEWVEIKFPRIIPDSLFEKVQRRLDKNIKTSKRSSKQDFLLTGLVKCECGMSRNADGAQKHKYYRCTDRLSRFPRERECYLGSLNVMVLEALVWSGLVKLITNPNFIQKQAEAWLAGQSDNQGQDNDITEQLTLLTEEAERYTIAFGQKAIELPMLEKLTKDLKRRQEALLRDHQSRRTQSSQLPTITASALTEQTINFIATLNLTDKRFVAEKLLEKVIATPSKVSLQGNLPFQEELHIYLRNENRHHWPA